MLKKNGICYSILNSSTIELHTDFYVDEVVDDYNIVELKIRDESIKLKDTFKLPLGERKIPYEVNYITKINNSTYLLQTEIKNKTSQYLLPLLGKLLIPPIAKKQLSFDQIRDMEKYCHQSYLINAYIGGESIDRLDGYMYLKFRFSPHAIYQTVEDTIVKTHPLFVKIIDLGDSYTYIKLRIPKEDLIDVRTCLEGRYSELSKELKAKIIGFYSLNSKSNLFQILYGKDEYRSLLERALGAIVEGELDSIPELNTELIML